MEIDHDLERLALAGLASLDEPLDAQLLLGTIEQTQPQAEEELLQCFDEFLALDVHQRLASDALMGALERFVQAYLDRVRSTRVVVQGDRCFAEVQTVWYRGTVDEVLADGACMVTLDDFVGRHRVARPSLCLDWELSADDSRGDTQQGTCELCERLTRVTAHHLRPKEMHQRLLKKGFTREELAKCAMICRPCHSAVHRAVQ